MKHPFQVSGCEMHRWLRDLFPLPRSITGPGVRQTLAYFQTILPQIVVHKVPSGTPVLDWVVPDEWSVREAYISDETGRRVVDFHDNNLHLIGYSEPIDTEISFEELSEHLYSLPDQPNAIPYITSYYKRRWGFCLTERQRNKLLPGPYRVRIDAELKPGVLNFGELLIPGESNEEIFISTYICHPSMANNELSGPVVAAALAAELVRRASLRYSYRFVWIPETIGSITYLAKNLNQLRKHVVAGFNLTCIGDERAYSYVPSRNGNTMADRAARHALWSMDPAFKRYTWFDRGSDERQYCAPGVDLPVASICRSKYGEFPEYHTSLDNLELVTPDGLAGGLEAVRRAIRILEANGTFEVTVLGEPQLGRRNLYPTLSQRGSAHSVRLMMDLISMCDGERDLLATAEQMGVSVFELLPHIENLLSHKIIRRIK